MKKDVSDYIVELVTRVPALEPCFKDIERAYALMEECYEKGGKLLIAGNGGSCADAEHMVGELMKSFKLPRKTDGAFVDALVAADPVRGKDIAARLCRGLPAVALNSHPGLLTATINDVERGGEIIFAQQLYSLGSASDLFFGISTSGNSEDVLCAAAVARATGMKLVSLTGETGGELAKKADAAIRVPARETYLVQELCLPVYHTLCLMLEDRFFCEEGR